MEAPDSAPAAAPEAGVKARARLWAESHTAPPDSAPINASHARQIASPRRHLPSGRRKTDMNTAPPNPPVAKVNAAQSAPQRLLLSMQSCQVHAARASKPASIKASPARRSLCSIIKALSPKKTVKTTDSWAGTHSHFTAPILRNCTPLVNERSRAHSRRLQMRARGEGAKRGRKAIRGPRRGARAALDRAIRSRQKQRGGPRKSIRIDLRRRAHAPRRELPTLIMRQR